jgi:hypothetical protein
MEQREKQGDGVIGETRRKRINSKAQSFYEIQTVKNLILTSKYFEIFN